MYLHLIYNILKQIFIKQNLYGDLCLKAVMIVLFIY